MELTRRSFALAGVVAALAATPISALAEEAAEAEGEAGAEEGAEQAGAITAPAGTVEAAAQLMEALQGEYVELFPVLEQYPDAWISALEPYVGEDAEDIMNMLIEMMEGELGGQEAIDAFGDMSQGFAFNCFFPQGIETITIEGNVVSGYDADGAEVFSHEYEYWCYNPTMGFYVFRTADEDAGEFKYFVPAPDNMADTWHLEFRLVGDLDDAFDFFTGAYAFTMPAAIAADATDEEIINCITLFVDENAGEM